MADGKVDRGPIELARTIENLDRDNLNPIEEGVAVAQLIDALPDDLGGGRFARNAYGPTPAAIEEVAARLHRPAKWVRDRLYFQRLGPKCRKWVAEGKLRLSFAREIAKLADHGAQETRRRLQPGPRRRHLPRKRPADPRRRRRSAAVAENRALANRRGVPSGQADRRALLDVPVQQQQRPAAL
jgi:hypothetical protein